MKTTAIFNLASKLDGGIRYDAALLPDLKMKRVYPEKYSREKLFSNMIRARVSLFSDFDVSIKTEFKKLHISQLLTQGIRQTMKISTQNGPSQTRKIVNIAELIQKWERGRGIISVTDLHFRNTPFERMVNAGKLSDFNIYCSNRELIDNLEMMTIVVSSKGNVTDSHSDDSDGSNHCFIGKKLWLVWDRLEGKRQKLEDVTRDDVYAHAHFNLRTFLSLSSAKWFTIQDNETLFLPGHLTHRVITLEKYAGIGSFHIAIPGYINSMRRWLLHGSTDVTPELLKTMNKSVLKNITTINHNKGSINKRLGLDFLAEAIYYWSKSESEENKARLLSNDLFNEFMCICRSFLSGVNMN
jgi:hypothetical protein